MRKWLSLFVFVTLCGIITIPCGGCKPQEPSKLIIAVDGRELSNAEIIIDEKSVGRLTQTIIMSDGKIYIDGILSVIGHHNNNVQQNDSYSGCSSTLHLTSGKHTITLQGSEIVPLTVVVNATPGHHMLVYIPGQDLVKWDNSSFQIGPGRKVTIALE